MVRFNNPRGHNGIIPSEGNIIGGVEPPTEIISDESGLFYRANLDLDIDSIVERIENIDPTVTITDYQYWAEGAWKTQHGTYDSVERFMYKLDEEHLEVIDAVGKIENRWLQGDSHSAENELGDLLWCLSALASNGAADVDIGLKKRLYKYVVGTQWIVENEPIPPPWRSEAANLAVKYDQITINEVDQLIEGGFEPNYSPVMNIIDPGDDFIEPKDHLLNLGGVILSSQFIARRQYGRNEDSTSEEIAQTMVLREKFNDLAFDLAETVATGLLEIAFLSNRAANTTLANVVQQNVRKVNERVKLNKVDKDDSPRV